VKKLLYLAVALFGLVAGQAMAGRTDVVILRWPTASDNTASATPLMDETATDGTLSLRTTVPALDLADYGATLMATTATPFFDNKLVIPFTSMGFAPSAVRLIVITSRDGSATDYNYVSFKANNGGPSAADAFYGKAIMTGGAPGSISQPTRVMPVPLARGAAGYGTIYVASPIAAADGLSAFQIQVYGKK
jgi:hypothetical protein